MQRRELFLGLAGLLVTPAIVRAQSLMPVSTRIQRKPILVIVRYDNGSPDSLFFLNDATGELTDELPWPWARIGGSLAIHEA